MQLTCYPNILTLPCTTFVEYNFNHLHAISIHMPLIIGPVSLPVQLFFIFLVWVQIHLPGGQQLFPSSNDLLHYPVNVSKHSWEYNQSTLKYFQKFAFNMISCNFKIIFRLFSVCFKDLFIFDACM